MGAGYRNRRRGKTEACWGNRAKKERNYRGLRGVAQAWCGVSGGSTKGFHSERVEPEGLGIGKVKKRSFTVEWVATNRPAQSGDHGRRIVK